MEDNSIKWVCAIVLVACLAILGGCWIDNHYKLEAAKAGFRAVRTHTADGHIEYEPIK